MNRPGLLGNIKANRTGLRQRQRFAAGAIGIDDHGNRADRIDLAELWSLMFAGAEVEDMGVKFQLTLRQHDGGTVPVHGITAIKFDHLKSPLLNANHDHAFRSSSGGTN